MDNWYGFPWDAPQRVMPPYLFDEQGLRYKRQRTTMHYNVEEQQYSTVGTYEHDDSKIEWDGEPQPDTPYQIKSPPWVEGLRMIKEGEKQWQQERRAKHEARSGGQG